LIPWGWNLGSSIIGDADMQSELKLEGKFATIAIQDVADHHFLPLSRCCCSLPSTY
jgi:hypothetical protein